MLNVNNMKKFWQRIVDAIIFALDIKEKQFNVGYDPGKGDDHTDVVNLPNHEESYTIVCEHEYGNIQFIKGGGHGYVCKKCGHVKPYKKTTD